MSSRKHKIFESLVRSYHVDLYRFALYLTHDDQTATDLVQEVYLRAWKNIRQLNNVSAAKSWLFTILSRENARKYQKHRPHFLNIDEMKELESDTELLDTMQSSQLRQAMLNLEIEYQEPLLLQIIGGFTTREISKMLALNENTISTRLFRARHQLKKIFDQNNSHQGDQYG